MNESTANKRAYLLTSIASGALVLALLGAHPFCELGLVVLALSVGARF
jgi:hypothetical protein